MLKEEAEVIEVLRECQNNGDTECAHGDADDALCEFLRALGYGTVVEEYLKVDKRCA